MKLIIIYSFLILLVCCTKKKEVVDSPISGYKDSNSSTTQNNIREDSLALMDINIHELENAVREKGDTLAYERLVTFYLTSEKLLPFSLIMADKYNYPLANFMVYSDLYNIVYPKKKDKATLEKAIKYLHRAAELGEYNACMKLGKYYFKGEYVEKDTVLGKKYLQIVGIDIDKPLREGSTLTYRNTYLKQ